VVTAAVVDAAQVCPHLVTPDAKVLEAAPLAVQISAQRGGSAISLVFTDHPRLSALAVAAHPPDLDIPSLLDPRDTGDCFPHFRALLAATLDGNQASPSAMRPAVPYRWVQHLGGITAEDVCDAESGAEADVNMRPLTLLEAFQGLVFGTKLY